MADGKSLVSGMDGLQVQSPLHGSGALPSRVRAPERRTAMSTMASAHDRSFSSSTESSSNSGSANSILPRHLGSGYGSEGYPNLRDFDESSPRNGFASHSPVDMMMTAQAAAAVAAADEAIKQLNGTSTVFQGPMTPGIPPSDNPYQLPRGYADFVKPQARSGAEVIPDQSVSRQSSTSSSTTEASTSSEESDLCVPTIEWVNRPTIFSPTNGHAFSQQSPYVGSPGTTFQHQKSAPGRSPGRMPPPATIGKGHSSPKRNHPTLAMPAALHHQSSLPLGATAHTPGGTRQQTSALPIGVSAEAPAEEDDDDATVGHGREQSPSTSSQSARSGLDLLWRAATHSEPVSDSPYETPQDSKGKRKAGAEAVAQWRTSGIPTGVNGKPVTTAEGQARAKEQQSMPPPASKRRRRSQLQMEAIDPALRGSEPQEEQVMEVDPGSDYQTGSGSEEGGEGASGDDSEYGAGASARPRGRAAGRGRAGGKKAGRGGRISTGGTTTTTAAKEIIKKARKSDGSPAGSGRGGGGGTRTSAGGASGVGIQCEYINPLPVSQGSMNHGHWADCTMLQPYNRCQDFFTRKYDLPRHMARHARREGELVYEGKLAEDKALLWRTIKDKPKVTCAKCGESFTR